MAVNDHKDRNKIPTQHIGYGKIVIFVRLKQNYTN